MTKWVNVVPLRHPANKLDTLEWNFCESCINEHGIIYSSKRRRRTKCDFCQVLTLCYTQKGHELGQMKEEDLGEFEEAIPRHGTPCCNCGYPAEVIWENRSFCYMDAPDEYWEAKANQVRKIRSQQWKAAEAMTIDHEEVTKEPEYVDHGSFRPQMRTVKHDGLLLPLE